MSTLSHTRETPYSRGRVSVATISDIGKRRQNEDTAIAYLASNTHSWLLAVADGQGNNMGGADAAQTAIASLPSAISTQTELIDAFRIVNSKVTALHSKSRKRRESAFKHPRTTLCVATWNIRSGIILGWIGDTLPFVVNNIGGILPQTLIYGSPQLNLFGTSKDSLGPLVKTSQIGDNNLTGFTMHSIALADVPQTAFAVVIATDGIWKPIALAATKQPTMDYKKLYAENWLGGLCQPRPVHASELCTRMLIQAHQVKRYDNATAAVAYVNIR